jgi:hypothetical protein
MEEGQPPFKKDRTNERGAVNVAEIYHTTKEVAQQVLDFADENLQTVRRLAPDAYRAALQLAGTKSQVTTPHA